MNAWIHAILSFLIPGLGQALSKKYVRALLMFIVAVAIDGVNFFYFGNSLWGNVIGIIYALLVAFDAYSIQKGLLES